MKKSNIKVAIGSREDMAAEFVKTWQQLAAGKKTEAIGEKIYFENARTLFKILSPKRCELLQYVHSVGEISILSLAKKLNRNYRNVHQDVKDLSQLDLILKNKETGKYFVPWSAIVTEISMTNIKFDPHDHDWKDCA